MEGYEIFLSYPAPQITECQCIYEAIRSWDYTVFFDEVAVQPGDKWPREVDRTIRTASVAVICLGEKGPGKRQIDEIDGLYDEQHRRPQLRLIPFLLAGANRDALPFYLRSARAISTLARLREVLAGRKPEVDLDPIEEPRRLGVTYEHVGHRDRRISSQSEERRESAPQPHRDVLPFHDTLPQLRAWLSAQDDHNLLKSDSQQQFLASIPSNPGIYTALAEQIACEEPPNPRVEHLLLRGFVDHYKTSSVKAELDRAFDHWLGFIHPAGSPKQAGQDDDKTQLRLQAFAERIGQPVEPGEIEIAGYRLTVVPEAGPLRLTRLALAVMSSNPQNVAIRSIARGCVAEAVMDYAEKYHLFAWLLRWSSEATWGQVEVEAKQLIASGHIAAKQAAFRLLSCQGSVQATSLQSTLNEDKLFPPDPRWAEYSDSCLYGSWDLGDCTPCLERVDVPIHILVRQVGPWCPEPSLEFPSAFIDRLAEKADSLTPEQVWQGMVRDHRLEELEVPLCAAAPRLYAQLIRRLVAEISESEGKKLWRWTLELKEHALCMKDHEQQLVYRKWAQLSQEKNLGADEGNAEMFLSSFILPQLTATQQLAYLLQRSRDTQDLERYEPAFLPLTDAAQIEPLLTSQDATSLHRARVLWFLSVNARAVPPEVLEDAPQFLEDEDSLVRYCALRLLYESKHPAAGRLVVEAGWLSGPEKRAIENHWGSLLLACQGQHLRFEELRERIDPAYLGLAVEKRGLIVEEVRRYADEIHGIWRRAVGQDLQPLESFPEAGIETSVSSTEPVFRRRRLIWDRYWHMGGMWFINPLSYWGRIPDEPDSDAETKPWEWVSEEQKMHARGSRRRKSRDNTNWATSGSVGSSTRYQGAHRRSRAVAFLTRPTFEKPTSSP